jgi:hypothetical protein
VTYENPAGARRPRLLLAVAGLLATTLAFRAGADIVITQSTRYSTKRGVETEAVEPQTYWLAETRARLEQGDEIYLIDLERGRYVYADSVEKHYDERAAPFDLANMVSSDFLEDARKQFAADGPSRVSVSEPVEAGRLHGYDVRRVLVTAGEPGDPVQAEIEMWVSQELWDRLTGTAYWALEKDRLATTPVTSWMVEPLASLEAFPVETRLDLTYRGRKTTLVRTLVSVSERELPESAYELSTDYTPFPDQGF